MDSIFHIQGPSINNSPRSNQLAPLFLIHAVSGFGLPYLSLGPLSPPNIDDASTAVPDRPVYGLSSPIYQFQSYKPGLSFAKIAKEYVERIKTVRPHGPYVLGGWSMGGVLAIKMADLLQQQGEEVSMLVLIDSSNPEGCPPFKSDAERESVVHCMYKVYAPRMGLAGWEKMDEEARENGYQDVNEEADDEDDEDVDISQYLPRMRAHISNSMDIISRGGIGSLLDHPIKCPVTLIKCTELAPLPPTMSIERQKAIEFRHYDERNGWPFENLEIVKINTEHDRCFDPDSIPIVTNTIREVVGRVR